MRDRRLDDSIRLPSAAPRRPLLLLLCLLTIAALLLVADQQGLLGPLRDRATLLLNPTLGALANTRARAEQFSRGVGDVARLREENAQLRAELSRLQAELVKAEPLLLENSRLRRQLRIEETTPWQLLGAEVNAFTPDAGRRTLRIARGSDDGVEIGMAVIGQEGSSPPALIGVVEQVQPRGATILMITDYGSAISAQLYEGVNVVEGLMRGQWQRGSRLHMEQIPRTAQLAEGDIVRTAGLSNRTGARLAMASIPAGIPIGTITEVRATDHTQTAEVQPFVDPDQVRYVWIILRHDG
jgi:rod shape-determining protein MreC